jgi:[ribosomal protein S5]-alanine N-acetyltransferase
MIPLETEQMDLRVLTAADVPYLFELDSDPATLRFGADQSQLPWPEFEQRSLSWISGFANFGPYAGYWVAESKKNRQFVGCFQILPNPYFQNRLELGYCIKPDRRGVGLATEGCRKVLEYAFEIRQMEYLMAQTLTRNFQSRRVLDKVGMQFEQKFVYPKELLPSRSNLERLTIRYSLTRAEWKEQKRSAINPTGSFISMIRYRKSSSPVRLIDDQYQTKGNRLQDASHSVELLSSP